MSSYPPCPLCGGWTRTVLFAGWFSVNCPACGLRGPTRATEEDAEAGWERLCSLASERDRMRDACSRINEEVTQTLGRALGYPPLYPEVSDIDDGAVCVGEHVAETIAAEAAGRLASMVRLPPGVEQIAGSVDDDGLEELARWSVTGGFSRGWSKLVVTDERANQTDGLTLQEACDQVRAELEGIGGDDDE